MGFHEPRTQTRTWPIVLKLAVKRVLDELVAVFQQIRPELTTRAAQAVQRVEVELARELAGNAVSSPWSAITTKESMSPPQRFKLTDNSSARLQIHCPRWGSADCSRSPRCPHSAPCEGPHARGFVCRARHRLPPGQRRPPWRKVSALERSIQPPSKVIASSRERRA